MGHLICKFENPLVSASSSITFVLEINILQNMAKQWKAQTYL